MTFEGLRRLNPRASRNVFLVGLAAGADRQATLARLERDASAAVPSRPADVANWGRVSGFPYVLAALIAAAAAAVLAHALVTSIRRRRRDLAILKTLGFERRDVRMTVAWQATTVAAIGLLVGLPLGVGIGRFAWNLFADGARRRPRARRAGLPRPPGHPGDAPARQPGCAAARPDRGRHAAGGGPEGGVRWPRRGLSLSRPERPRWLDRVLRPRDPARRARWR